MEVTEIILAKVSRLCQLSSHCRGFLSRLLIYRAWPVVFFRGGGGTGVCLPFSLSSIFYSWIFSLLVFYIYFNETYSKQSKIYRKISRKKFVNKKSQNFSQMFVISIKKTIPYSLDLKIYRKSIALPIVIDFYSL